MVDNADDDSPLTPSPDGDGLWSIGRTVGKYRIEGVLGVGGTAAVYAARHRNGHRVALKVLHARVATTPASQRRFLREAHLANRIQHPGVVPILDDAVTGDGQAYLVIELLDGESLGAMLRRAGPLQPLDVAAVAAGILDVLVAAHAMGVVHRDLKPDNVFLCRDGRLRVLDFGTARDPLGSQSVRTPAGMVLGTPAFMAPEQARGRAREIGPRADLWGVGATMWNLVTGQLVHGGDGSVEETLFRAATRAAPPLAHAMHDVDPRLAALVDRALSFDACDRWPDAQAMWDAARLLCPDAAAALVRLGASIPASPRLDRADLARPSPDAGETRTAQPMTRGQTGADVESAGSPPTDRLEAPHRLPGVHGWKRAIVLGATVFGVALVGAVVTLGRRGAEPRGTPGALRASASPLPVGATSAAPAGGAAVRGGAIAQLDAGIQLWRDMSHWEALARFSDAAREDPSLARAHLYCVLVLPWVDEPVRVHYRRALDQRAQLTRDELVLLEALAPSMQSAPDVRATVARLSSALGGSQDFFTLAAIAVRAVTLEPPGAALDVLAAHPAPDASPAFEPYTRAAVAIAESRGDDAERALDACLTASPTAGSCLRWRTGLRAHGGAIPQAEEAIAQWIAAWPDLPDPYEWLASVTWERSRSAGLTRAALGRRWALTPDADRSAVQAEDQLHLALRLGDLALANRYLDAWERAASSSGDTRARLAPAVMRFELDYETAPAARLQQTASAYADESTVWTAHPSEDARVMVARMQLLAGALSEADVARRRTSWLADAAASGFYDSPARRWFNFYAELAVTPALAQQALQNLPPQRPFLDPYRCDAHCEETIGAALFAARDLDGALPHLARAAASCSWAGTLYQLRAKVLLAEVLEARREHGRACALLRDVREQWRLAPDTRIVRDARAAAERTGCPR